MHLNFAAMPNSVVERDPAIKLVEFLTSLETQTLFTGAVYHYPVNPMVIPDDFVIQLGGFKEVDMDLNNLGLNGSKVAEIIEAAKL